MDANGNGITILIDSASSARWRFPDSQRSAPR